MSYDIKHRGISCTLFAFFVGFVFYFAEKKQLANRTDAPLSHDWNIIKLSILDDFFVDIF